MLQILDLEKSEDLHLYKKLLVSIDSKCPYYSIEFFDVFSSGKKGLRCFKWEQEGRLVLLPGYIRDIKGHSEYKDFISPYGYSGPISNMPFECQSMEQFWNELEEWFVQNKFVTSFIRFSLDDNWLGFPQVLKETMSNIKGQILPAEEQWNNFERKVRKNVNKAKREQLTIRLIEGKYLTSEELTDFYEIYISTMQRTQASDSFFYPKEMFTRYIAANPDCCLFALVYDAGQAISSELVLLSKDCGYSFLGGTLDVAFDKRPNDFLKFEVINWLREHQYQYFVLGGGYGSDDGIFRYKLSFFPKDTVSFFTGRSIYNQALYDQFVLEHLTAAGLKLEDLKEIQRKDFFPEYRRTY